MSAEILCEVPFEHTSITTQFLSRFRIPDCYAPSLIIILACGRPLVFHRVYLSLSVYFRMRHSERHRPLQRGVMYLLFREVRDRICFHEGERRGSIRHMRFDISHFG